MAKARVSALAKEVGLQSKQLIEWLNNNGEYVKTPSSTIEAPVVAKVYAAFPPVPEDQQKPAKKDRRQEVGRGRARGARRGSQPRPAPVAAPDADADCRAWPARVRTDRRGLPADRTAAGSHRG